MSSVKPQSDTHPVVRIKDLNHEFVAGPSRKRVLTDINLSLMPGEIVIMTGPSGSGKTTLLVLTGALRSVQEGTLEVMGQDLRGLSATQLVEVRRRVGFIFQAHNLFESLTALENVQLGMELHSYSERERRELGEAMLTTLGLGHRIHYKPAHMSGGEKQRVAVARAMVNRPKLILADEPTAALDKNSGRIVVNLLKEHAKEQGGSVILVTHDNRILDIADRIVTLVDGRIASSVVVGESMFISESLKHCGLFQHLTPSELGELAQKMVREDYPAGKEIVREGEQGDKFFLIWEGEVEVVVKDEQGERVVNVLDRGKTFGETALLKNQPRNATIRARGDAAIYSLNKEAFLAALASSLSFQDQMRQVFAMREVPHE